MKELLELLNQKKELLKDLYKYIDSQSFKNDEEEVPKILEYVDKKQGYIDKLNELEIKIKAFPKDNGDHKDVKAIEEENNSLIHNIISSDKNRLEIMNNLKDKLKLGMKGAKIQQKYNTSYSNYAMDIRGSMFDGKQ